MPERLWQVQPEPGSNSGRRMWLHSTIRQLRSWLSFVAKSSSGSWAATDRPTHTLSNTGPKCKKKDSRTQPNSCADWAQAERLGGLRQTDRNLARSRLCEAPVLSRRETLCRSRHRWRLSWLRRVETVAINGLPVGVSYRGRCERHHVSTETTSLSFYFILMSPWWVLR